MEFHQLNGFVADKENGIIGAVAGVDFIKQTISILTDDEEIFVVSLGNVEFLEEIGAIGQVGVINHDVVGTADGKLYEIVLVDKNSVQLHLLNKKLERVEAGDVIAKTDLHVLAPYVEVLGNLYELEPENVVDFNIKVVRKNTEDGVVFFYACNNVEREEVDLIKVVFVGHQILKEETYQRITVSHDEYLELVENGVVIETDPSALLNYVTGLMYGKSEVAVDVEDEDFEDDFEDEDEDLEEEYCEECGETVDNCDCSEW